MDACDRDGGEVPDPIQGDFELTRAGAEPIGDAIRERSAFAVRGHGKRVEQAAGPQMSRHAADDAAKQAIAVVPGFPNKPLLLAGEGARWKHG